MAAASAVPRMKTTNVVENLLTVAPPVSPCESDPATPGGRGICRVRPPACHRKGYGFPDKRGIPRPPQHSLKSTLLLLGGPARARHNPWVLQQGKFDEPFFRFR